MRSLPSPGSLAKSCTGYGRLPWLQRPWHHCPHQQVLQHCRIFRSVQHTLSKLTLGCCSIAGTVAAYLMMRWAAPAWALLGLLRQHAKSAPGVLGMLGRTAIASALYLYIVYMCAPSLLLLC